MFGNIESHLEELTFRDPDTVSESTILQDMKALVKRLACTPEEKEKWEILRLQLENLSRRKWRHYTIDAYLFGSTSNTLGATGCDIDICLKVMENGDAIRPGKIQEVIKGIHAELKKERFESCQAILHARVPHLKFYAPDLGWGDVSINTTDSLQKTRLLKSYCELDERIRPVILVIKEWIHQRKINQASLDGGTLNSFCYTLMFIAFMQIKYGLPSLQQVCCLAHASRRKELPYYRAQCKIPMQTWFFDDISSLKELYQPNEDSIAKVLQDFLHFYAYELDYFDQVVSIRVGALIPRKEKNWLLDRSCSNPQAIKLLCVEDPFDLSRNVATSAKPWVVEGIRWEFERAARELHERGLSGMLEKHVPPLDISGFAKQYPWSLYNNEIPLRGSSKSHV
ncbi:PAP/OAS1 substrate-binding domain-containing protein [Basidiobolus meristosporus CBS 931.73]|uniref:polynucleotide adenylyltransferase n=1 Tax=Basidiobolus meristosporus CBS 931.73 TaxID=1314790 RepID=A0A1Y1XS64_9FUNG|nr:PAP/OAS1 substrate-binding domain-containing protein [Basidiobolus meristosporus CBS 931.73]|eukprot:ORX88580.1 PAP/OAS1 substrate-binding domain-containing protein [Basidiobolus meristosporus CBS 931.73]